MRSLLIYSVLFFALLVPSSACVKAPPNLTPQAVSAFNNTRVQKTLDLLRDTVDDGTKTTPPIFSKATDVKVATWHKSALTIIHSTGNGWKSAIMTSLDELPKDLPPAEAKIIKDYITLAKAIISEVAP